MNDHRFVSRILAFAGVIALCACGTPGSVPKLSPEEAKRFESAGNFPHESYRIEPGDRIAIRFVYHPEMNQDAIVRPDGKIRANAVGDILVAGRSTTEVEDELEKATASRLRDPETEVSIAEYTVRSVFVTGEVAKPGPIIYRKGLTPLQAVIQAGGFRETALIDHVVLIRATDDKERFISRAMDLRDVLHHGEKESVRLAPRDVVYVPKTRIAETDLWIDQHVTRLFPFIRGTGASFPLGF